MAQKKTLNKKTSKTRARTQKGAFIADDPITPENEAWVEDIPEAQIEVSEAVQAVRIIANPEEIEPVTEEEEGEPVIDKNVCWYESREKEPYMFPVAGIQPIRNFQSGRLEYEVSIDDVERFESNHFIINGRIIRRG